MNIKFTEERFNQLLEEARVLDISIPKLIDSVLDTHYVRRRSHRGVNTIGTKIRKRVSTDPERCTHPYKS
ncbi:MAG: hypothetical protein GY928_25055 [Colwellia sp.]|nr:hypothetical protein [Colwellia sp.]